MKICADAVFMAAYHQAGFPVTIIKPSTTYGPVCFRTAGSEGD